VNNLIGLGGPVRPEYQLLNPSSVQNFVHVFNSNDGVQKIGGGQNQILGQEFGPAGQTQADAVNLNWNVDLGAIGSHSGLHTPDVWEFVLPHLDLPQDASWGELLKQEIKE
jgi:hypothetical protein